VKRQISRLIAWFDVQGRRGNERMDRALDWIGSLWRRAVPGGARRVLEWIGRHVLQLDSALTPAVVAVASYLIIDRLGPAGAMVLLLLPLTLWSHAICRRRLSYEQQRLGVVVAFVVLLAAPVFLVFAAPRFWDRIGASSGYTFRLALYGMLLAGLLLGLRIAFGHRSQPVRGVAVAGAALAVVIAASSFIGQLPGWWLIDAPSRLASATGWPSLIVDMSAAAAAGAVLFVATRKLELPGTVHRMDVRMVPFATGIAWILPAVLVYGATIEAGERGAAYLRAEKFERGLLPAAAPDSFTPKQLAVQYGPVFMLSQDERWPIDAVDDYVSDATVARIGNGKALESTRPGTPANLPRSCPDDWKGSSTAICYSLTAGCRSVRRSCDHGHDGEWPDGPLNRGKVYARVLIRGQKQVDGSPDAFKSPVPFPDLYALIQYWVFYRNDLWRADTGLGQAVQRHEADWEHVIVGLGHEAPQFVAYSAHCGGVVSAWEHVQAIPAGGSVHPVVWVARGSHANYPDPAPRIPDFTSCPHAPASRKRLLSVLAFAANVRETLPGTFVQQEPAVKTIDARDQPFSFPGRWSTRDEIVFSNTFREAEIPPPKKREPGAAPPVPTGPETPTCKDNWRDPLAIVACSPYWGELDRCVPELANRYNKLKHLAPTCI
jgi:hypothetical protein